MAALKFLAIVRLLLVTSPGHEMNMTHTKSLNLKRHGHIGGNFIELNIAERLLVKNIQEGCGRHEIILTLFFAITSYLFDFRKIYVCSLRLGDR